MAEQHTRGPEGQTLPPGMFYRDGIYYVRSTVAGRRVKKSTHKRDFKSALRRYHEIMLSWNNQASGWASPEDVPTLKDYWATYRASWVVGRKTPVRGQPDLYRDDSLVASALFLLGPRRLTEITPTMAQRWAQKRRQGTYQRKQGGTEHPIAEGTVTREVSLLQAIFEHAIADGHIEKNPWTNVERRGYEARERVLSPSEQGQLESVLAPRYSRFMNFLLGTGLRIQEALNLNEATDVNLEQKWVLVTRKSKGLKKKEQKISIFDDAVIGVLREQLEAEGQLWHQNASRFRHVLQEKTEALGIPHVSPHTLRHTFATRYLQRGGDIYILSRLLGHSSVAITERIYAHLVSEDLGARSAGITLGVGVASKVLPFKKGLTT